MTRLANHSEATYGPHDLHGSDSSQPYELRAYSAQGPITCMGVEIPKILLPLPRNRIDRLVERGRDRRGSARS